MIYSKVIYRITGKHHQLPS
uniref:Uncharacterized protein n=1 Tax=Anguilla anguilla TaxID=7936 RepID=A0A0E9PVQ9_ANGAN